MKHTTHQGELEVWNIWPCHLAGKEWQCEGWFRSSGMLKCGTGETVPHILKIALPSKLWELFIQWHKVTPLNTWIISNTNAKTSNLATKYLYTCQNYLTGKNNNVPKTGKIPYRYVKYNPLLCQSHHPGAEHTIEGIMAGQTPLMSSSRGHKKQRGTTASNTPLPNSSWKLALRSAPLTTTYSVLKNIVYTVGFTAKSHTENNILKILSNAQSHKMPCFHAPTGGQSLFHSTGLQHESNMASLQLPSTCLHSHPNKQNYCYQAPICGYSTAKPQVSSTAWVSFSYIFW